MSNYHKDMEDESLHVAKDFANGVNGSVPWKNEQGLQKFISKSILPNVLGLAASNAAPPSENDGDTYLIGAERAQLTVSAINWQSGTTVRYSFSGSPDLSAYVIGDYIIVVDAVNTEHNGTFAITAFSDGSDYIEVTNLLVTDATLDETTGATVTSTLAAWDGCPQNSWVRYDSILDSWFFVALNDGQQAYDSVLKQYYVFNGTSIEFGSSVGAWTNVAYSASDFGEDGTTDVWTVDAGDVLSNKYVLNGKTMTWQVSITGAALTGGDVCDQIRINIPGGYSTSGAYTAPCYLASGSTHYADAYLSLTTDKLYISRLATAEIANGDLAVFFTITFEVQ